eukprot:319900-Alexandrium_andersonii.AAC.1
MVRAAARSAALSLGAAEPVALRGGCGAGIGQHRTGVYMPVDVEAQPIERMVPLPLPGVDVVDPTDSEGYQSADGGEAQTANI